MFVEAAIALGPNDLAGANAILTNFRPAQIADFLEEYWQQGVAAANHDLGVPPGDLPQHQDQARAGVIDTPAVPNAALGNAGTDGWHHLVYAFMLEQTRIYDIFRRVVHEYAHGERLPHATNATLRWLRTTEELFFSTPRSLTIRSTTSNLRPDDAAVRRNAYYRMLGMDLMHGSDDGRPYPYAKAEAANRDFVQLFEALLTEVWRGFANRNNANNLDETDDGAIAILLERLREMMIARRLNGLLSREEFDAVATLSWFRLVVSLDTAIVINLSAQAAGEADRLKQIGSMVGVNAHSRTDAYFRLAQPMSVILREIENQNIFNAGPGALYVDLSPYQAPMLEIITNWSIAAGRDLKDGSRSKVTLPTLTETARASQGNGKHVPLALLPAALPR